MKQIISRCLATVAMALMLGVPEHALAQDHSARPIDAKRFYKGVWLEVARRPMWITDGCVVGTTIYAAVPGTNEVRVRDACRKGGPSGPETALDGVGEILDPGVNSRLQVRYNPLLTVEYDIIEVAPDYSWFIATSPTLDNLFIYMRTHPSRKKLDSLVARARMLGFDTSTLEFPWAGH